MSSQDLFKKVVSHAKEYGYIFQSSEIYDGLSEYMITVRMEVVKKKFKRILVEVYGTTQ